jgi:hypothetical protein
MLCAASAKFAGAVKHHQCVEYTGSWPNQRGVETLRVVVCCIMVHPHFQCHKARIRL